MEVKQAMAGYFDRLLEACRSKDPSLPIACMVDGADPSFYEAVLEDDWRTWKPKEKTDPFDFSELESILGYPVHDSVKEYVNSFWFANIGGTYESYKIQLDPVVPGNFPADFLTRLAGYRLAHERKLKHVPIGWEGVQDLLVVVENATGEVMLEDYDVSSFERIASDLAHLISNLRFPGSDASASRRNAPDGRSGA